MKQIIFFVCILASSFMKGQELIEKVTLSNGVVVLLYGDNSWKYEDSKTTNQQINSLKQKNEAINTTSKIQNKPIRTKESTAKRTPYSSDSYSSVCGARTRKGGYCQRKVSGGGRCHQHR